MSPVWTRLIRHREICSKCGENPLQFHFWEHFLTFYGIIRRDTTVKPSIWAIFNIQQEIAKISLEDFVLLHLNFLHRFIWQFLTPFS